MAVYDKSNIEEYLAFAEKHENSPYMKIRGVLLDIAKSNNLFRFLSRKYLYSSRTRKYKAIADSVAVDENVIIFSSFCGRSYSDSPRAMYEYMLSHEEYDNFTFIWEFKNPYEHRDLLDNPRTYLVRSNSKSYYEQMAKAKYWVMNYRVGDHVFPKDEQVYFQLWHGTPLKRLGYDIINSENVLNSIKEIRMKYDIDSMKFDYLLAPSEATRDIFASAWNLKAKNKEDCVFVCGYPRNDLLSNYTQNDVDKIKKELNLPNDKKIILYAPTWRDNQHDSKIGYTYTTEIDFDLLREKLEDEYVIVFRAHYLVANSFDFEKYSGFIYDASKVNDINSLYIASDMLITDYSSVFFDYSILGRPILYYMYDFERYANDIRGFYLDIEELPGPIVKETDKLIDNIKNVDEIAKEYSEKYKAFQQKFVNLEDGNCSKRCIDKLLEK